MTNRITEGEQEWVPKMYPGEDVDGNVLVTFSLGGDVEWVRLLPELARSIIAEHNALRDARALVAHAEREADQASNLNGPRSKAAVYELRKTLAELRAALSKPASGGQV